MVIGAAIWLALAGVPQSAPVPDRGNLGEALYYAGTYASGSKFCDRRWSERLGKRFARRFGARIEKLTRTHVALYGPDPDFIYTSDCLIPSDDYDQDEAMRKFEPVLRDLERRFGGY